MTLLSATKKWIFGQLVVPQYGIVDHPRGKVLDAPTRPAKWLIDQGYAVEFTGSQSAGNTVAVRAANCDPSGGIRKQGSDPCSWASGNSVLIEKTQAVGPSEIRTERVVSAKPSVAKPAAETTPEVGIDAPSSEPESTSTEVNGEAESTDWQQKVVHYLNTKGITSPQIVQAISGIGPKTADKFVSAARPLTWEAIASLVTEPQIAALKAWATK